MSVDWMGAVVSFQAKLEDDIRAFCSRDQGVTGAATGVFNSLINTFWANDATSRQALQDEWLRIRGVINDWESSGRLTPQEAIMVRQRHSNIQPMLNCSTSGTGRGYDLGLATTAGFATTVTGINRDVGPQSAADRSDYFQGVAAGQKVLSAPGKAAGAIGDTLKEFLDGLGTKFVLIAVGGVVLAVALPAILPSLASGVTSALRVKRNRRR